MGLILAILRMMLILAAGLSQTDAALMVIAVVVPALDGELFEKF